jgi:hypothetical protein
MENNEIIVNKDLGLVYCDNIIDNGRVYRALASAIHQRYLNNIRIDDVFDIQLIYNKQHAMVAEYEFIYNKTHGMELETINMNQIAINIIVYKEGAYIVPDRNAISKELALRMYNKFKEVFGCK